MDNKMAARAEIMDALTRLFVRSLARRQKSAERMKGQRYIVDRVGEETDLEKCSVCHALSCFSCVQDHCTALGKFSTGGCVFYKDAEENLLKIRRCFYRLISHERFDLLYKYADTMAALGLMNQELKDAEKTKNDVG